MRLTFLIAAGLMTAGFVACSKPSPTDQAKSSRQILLPKALPLDAAVASDLETGRPVKLKQATSPVSARVPVKTQAMPIVARAQLMSVPASPIAETERPLELIPAPSASAVPQASTVGEEWQAGTYHGHQVDAGGGGSGVGGSPRGPGIIIRGGLGGVDDKCDLRPRGWRGGIAINRSVPSFGGYPQGIR
jgi:hypothetical protein